MSPTINEKVFQAASEQCEENVISKLIKILQVALQCSGEEGVGNASLNQTLLSGQDLKFAGNLLDKLMNVNDTFLNNTTESFGQSRNMTNIDAFKPEPPVEEGLSPPHRLQRLEMIKVGVLVFVISIIMLTTCRMIFQLFVRFRPEKSQMH